MSQSTITLAFEQWKAQQAVTGEALALDEFVFAFVPDLDASLPIDRSETLPPEAQIVHRQAVSRSGVFNDNAVVYSVVLGADTGDFDFNWIGLRNIESGTLAMIVHAPVQQKIKTAEGQQGNVLTRSFLMEYNGAQAETGINTPAETWQIDFTARLGGMDERQRIENIDIYGRAAFFGDGGLVGKTGNQFFVTKGAGYVAGLRAELAENANIVVTTKPVKVWLDVCWKGTLTSVWGVQSKISVAVSLDDYELQGVKHYVFALASIDENGAITDLRPKGSRDNQQANSDFLRKDKNLSDVSNPATARKNLSIKSAALLDAGYAAGQVPVNDANGDLLVPTTRKVGVQADERNEVSLLNSRELLGNAGSYATGGMVGATRYSWYDNRIDTGLCRDDSKGIQGYAVSFNGAKKFTVTSSGINVLGDSPSYSLCTPDGQQLASVGYSNGITLVGGQHGAWTLNDKTILAPSPKGEAAAGIRVSPEGGVWNTWRTRSSGLQLDMGGKAAAYNVFKATQWGSVHACSLDVSVDGLNTSSAYLHVGGADFQFTEGSGGLMTVPNLFVSRGLNIGDNDSGFWPYGDGAVGLRTNGVVNGYFNSQMIYHNNTIRAEKIMSGASTYQSNGDIYGTAWGGWLSGWVLSGFVQAVRFGAAGDYQERNLNERVNGGVMTSFADKGSSNYWIRIRPLQYLINGNWYTAGYS